MVLSVGWSIQIVGWAELHLRLELSIGVRSDDGFIYEGHIDLFEYSHEGQIYPSKYIFKCQMIYL